MTRQPRRFRQVGTTFLETDEDEGDDVSDIVGGEREDEEDT